VRRGPASDELRAPDGGPATRLLLADRMLADDLADALIAFG
jgi:hypothetical protein